MLCRIWDNFEHYKPIFELIIIIFYLIFFLVIYSKLEMILNNFFIENFFIEVSLVITFQLQSINN